MLSFNRTRLAPTPSGFLHIGNAFSFALTAAVAEKANAEILLRIDDMDRDRVEPEYIEDIFETMRFLDIPWGEGPKNAVDFEAGFSQRHRLPMYNAALEKLLKTGLIYACDCSRKQILERDAGVYKGFCRHRRLPLDAPGVSWRIDTDSAGEILVKNVDGSIFRAAMPDDMRHFVVRKKDGFPAYQLTSLVDDLHFNVDLIVRGEDLWPSTLAQLFLAQALGGNRFLQTAFYHHALLLDGMHKLSKSSGDTSVASLRAHGKTASQVYGLIGAQAGICAGHWRDFARFFAV
jgi:glutamyl-tRNA synthetase